MRCLFLLAAAALFAAPAAAADLPAVVVNVKPIGPLFEDIRAGARMVGGPDAVEKLDAEMKKALGEKGFAGIDLTRPVVGYAVITEGVESAEKTPFVFAVPVTSEDAFLDLIARANKGTKAEPVEGKKGLYRLPATRPLNAPEVDAPPAKDADISVMRFQGDHAYVTQEWNAAALDPAALVPAGKLVLSGETAQVAVRVTFDRFPESVRTKFAEKVEEALKEIRNAPLPLENVENRELAEKMEKKLREMFARYVGQLKEANEAAVRIVFDPKSGETGVEFALSAKPGTSLAADIAARKPNANRFAALVGPESAAGLKFTLLLFGQDGRDLIATAIESGSKQALQESTAPEQARPLLKEVSDGVVRTVRSGPVDLAAGLAGPDRNGTFTAVAAVSFDDPSKLEKELKGVVKEMAPPEVQDLVKFDAAKAGSVNIHLITPPPGQLPPEVQTVFGESARVALAFAPKGIYVAFGPDPVATLQGVVGKEPREARVLDVVVNPARLRKLVAAVGRGEEADRFLQMIGDRDELYSVLFVNLEGGTELRARVGFNLKLIGGVASQTTQNVPPAAAPRK